MPTVVPPPRFEPADSLPNLCRACWREKAAHDDAGTCPPLPSMDLSRE